MEEMSFYALYRWLSLVDSWSWKTLLRLYIRTIRWNVHRELPGFGRILWLKYGIRESTRNCLVLMFKYWRNPVFSVKCIVGKNFATSQLHIWVREPLPFSQVHPLNAHLWNFYRHAGGKIVGHGSEVVSNRTTSPLSRAYPRACEANYGWNGWSEIKRDNRLWLLFCLGSSKHLGYGR